MKRGDSATQVTCSTHRTRRGTGRDIASNAPTLLEHARRIPCSPDCRDPELCRCCFRLCAARHAMSGYPTSQVSGVLHAAEPGGMPGGGIMSIDFGVIAMIIGLVAPVQ